MSAHAISMIESYLSDKITLKAFKIGVLIFLKYRVHEEDPLHKWVTKAYETEDKEVLKKIVKSIKTMDRNLSRA